MAIDPQKVKAFWNCYVPSSLKQLRGFLGLSGYYRRFIMNYAQISCPMVFLLKGNKRFVWTDATQQAFMKLKDVVTTTSVLALLVF